LVGAVDDTLARKSGRHIWGAGMHHDPLRSTQKRPFFAFGHNFVVFSLQVALPFAPNKYWAFPILVRMYRKRQTHQRAPGKGGKLESKQTGQATPQQYRTRPELALEMIQTVASWIPDRVLRVLADSEYAAGDVGQQVLLWGSNLLGATAVNFNGTAATTFKVASVQGVYADVPNGATTGPITVTTPNGSSTTSQSFTVQ